VGADSRVPGVVTQSFVSSSKELLLHILTYSNSCCVFGRFAESGYWMIWRCFSLLKVVVGLAVVTYWRDSCNNNNTDSESPHRCCHLPNNVEIFPNFPSMLFMSNIPYSYNGLADGPSPKNCPFRWRDSGLLIIHDSESTPKRHVHQFSTSHGCDQQTDRQSCDGSCDTDTRHRPR